MSAETNWMPPIRLNTPTHRKKPSPSTRLPGPTALIATKNATMFNTKNTVTVLISLRRSTRPATQP